MTIDTRPDTEVRLSERVKKLRKVMLGTPAVSIERAYLMTESYRETESDPAVIRRAKAIKKILSEMTVRIEEGELIVGSAIDKRRGGILIPEVNWHWYLEQMDEISTREWDRFLPLSEDEKTKMKEFLPYWEGKCLYDKWSAIAIEDSRKFLYATHIPAPNPVSNMHLGHFCPNHEKVINKGLNSIKKEVSEAISKLNLAENLEDFRKLQFLKAVDITLEATISFAGRYAALARKMAEKEPDAVRKKELLQIAETCKWVPANPARNFYEALQAMWFAYTVIMIEGWGPSIGFGRVDQFLYPSYKKDIEEGRITEEQAAEYIALFYIKLNEFMPFSSSQFVRSQPGSSLGKNLTLGGINREGKDMVNKLSYLFLEVEKNLKLHCEELVIRVNKANPDSFLIKACELAKLLKGKLKFVSDDTAIMQLLTDGKPLELAREYAIVGCLIPTLPARSFDSCVAEMINLPLLLELALNNGISRITGEQMGIQTGDPRKFSSYEEVWEAYKKQVEHLVRIRIGDRNASRQLYAEYLPTPFQSALFEGCIEKGMDVTWGGMAPLMTQAWSAGGAPNVGDSLAAIKKAVFEDKKITMERLIDALDKNFEGEEEVLHFLNRAPKFGNDIDYVDSIVNEVLVHVANEAGKYKGFAGAISNMSAALVTANLTFGRYVGALPDGRKAGEPISEGGISPYQGRNTSGPTATMRSVAKIDHVKLTNGSAFNMKFHPDALKDSTKMRKFASMIRTFFETGGFLVQFNIVSSETLRDAQKHPEKYRDLLVRVATYSAYFVDLPAELQNDIIARIEFQEV